MNLCRSGCRRPPSRCGQVIAELVIVFPILLALLLGTILFSLLLTERQQVLFASREGARVAARGGSDAEVEDTVRTALGGADSSLGSLAEVTITPIPADTPNTRPGVKVCVEVPANATVPNLLPFIFNVDGHSLVACTTMNME